MMKLIHHTNYILYKFKLNTKLLRLCSQQTTATELKLAKDAYNSKKHSKEIQQYMSSKPELLEIKDKIPIRFFKKTRKAPDDLYLVDKDVGKTIAASLVKELKKRKNTIIETNPGFGFVTKELLKSGVKNIQLYESSVNFRDEILTLDRQYPGRIKIYNRDFFSIWRLSYQDRQDNGDRVKRMLRGVKVREWDDIPAMSVIGTVATTNFIRHLLLSLIFQFGVMTYGRCELFLVLPPPIYIQLTAGPKTGYLLYRASSVLFQIFCDVEILEKLPRQAFLPWDSTRTSQIRMLKVNSIDIDSMYLVRIEFKRELPIPFDRLQHLWYFVQHMMLSRSSRVIPLLEKWISGCGTRLILADNKLLYPNMDIYTQIGQMNSSQILYLYKLFSDWPEYHESSFISSMEVALLNKDNMQDLDEHKDSKDGESEPTEDTKLSNNKVSVQIENK